MLDHSTSGEVADDGPGMSPKMSGEAFEPVFGTKPVGRRIRFGPARLHGVAQRSGGAATVEGGAEVACGAR